MKLIVFEGISKLEVLDKMAALVLENEDVQILSKHWDYSSKYDRWFGHILCDDVVRGEIT